MLHCTRVDAAHHNAHYRDVAVLKHTPSLKPAGATRRSGGYLLSAIAFDAGPLWARCWTGRHSARLPPSIFAGEENWSQHDHRRNARLDLLVGYGAQLGCILNGKMVLGLSSQRSISELI